MSANKQDKQWVSVGKLGSSHGIRGWIKVVSYTQPAANILDYLPWYTKDGDSWKQVDVIKTQELGNKLIAQIGGYSDREQVRALTGTELSIQRDQLPPIDAGEYYWSDLEGLNVFDTQGEQLGTVKGLFETGSNDVIIVAKGKDEILVPYIPEQVVLSIDLDNKTMTVDWDPEY